MKNLFRPGVIFAISIPAIVVARGDAFANLAIGAVTGAVTLATCFPVLGGVGALVGLDAVRGGAEQLGKILSPGNIGLRGGKVGRRSARQ